jgi:Dolichyl-phosphate-mannose-protein mannosyltransferase
MEPVRSRVPSVPALVVGAMLVVCVAVRFAVAQRFTVPWIAPDEMLYGLLGMSLWDDGTLSIRGGASPYYSLLTPALVGAGFAGRELGDGLRVAQLLQLLAMSSAALPAYLWARRLSTAWWGVAAAAITISGPVLTYGGLLMTEALFYPACVWATYAFARALERPTLERQGLFLLTVTIAGAVRMQAIVLLPAFALAAWLYARVAPGERRFRPLAPLALGIAGAIGAAGLIRVFAPDALGSDDLLGAYATLGESNTLDSGLGVALVGHLGAVVLAACVVPAIATGVLVVEVLRRRVDGPSTQAFAATTAAFVSLLVVQVALFATNRLDHVSQRYLIAALPVLAVGLSAWVGAGAPRPLRTSLLVGAGLIATVAFVAPGDLSPSTSMHDALSTTALLRLAEHPDLVRIGLVSLTALGAVLVMAIPRRWLGVLPIVTVALLIATSVDAALVVTRLSEHEERDALGGGERNWIDLNAPGPVTLFVTGDRPWATESRTVFWNTSVREVLVLPEVGGGVPATTVVVDSGTGDVFASDGRPIERELLVAIPRTVMLDGEELARMPVGDATSPGLVLWRAAVPLRVAARVAGVLPNGDFSGRMTVTVPGCVRGALEVTLIGKSGYPIRVEVNGVPATDLHVPAETTPTVAIPAPEYVNGTAPCEFLLQTAGYVGTTRIAYVPTG